MERVMAWRIHHVAYVENLYPRRYSNLSTAFIRPMLPSWIKSRNCRPRRYKKLKGEIIAEVKSLRLNQALFDALVDQLYDINKRLVGHEVRLMRLAESHGVAREDFLKNY